MVVDSISPDFTVEDSDNFTLTVNGSYFTNESKIKWGTVALDTIFISANQLTAEISPPLISEDELVNISVLDPLLGVSNIKHFVILAKEASEKGLCFPIKTKNNAVALICL
ncbi:MAG: IPT/TIG domain-containing protein [Pseudomonadota bacterium]|nr:IPT/TIG domain-containing protein [Pseudomonadota bacterium]